MTPTITISDLQSMDAPADGWYHIESNDDHPGASADGDAAIQVLDNDAMRAIVEAGCPEEGILIDREHRSVPRADKPRQDDDTEAMGWVRRLAVFDDGEGHLQLAGYIEWSDMGLTAIKGRRYKHFSTVYVLDDPDCAELLGGNRYRPLALLGLAVTNRPNNLGQRPIVNSAGQLQTPQPTHNQHTDIMNELETIKQALGLAPDAPLDEALAAIDSIKASADEAAEAEAETLLNSEGLDDLPEEEKKELKDGLVTNRGLALLTIKSLKARRASDGVAKYARNKSGRTASVSGKASGKEAADIIINSAREIQTRERAAGRSCSFWKARAMAL